MGQYAPTILGEIEGIKIGIEKDINSWGLWMLAKKMDYDSLGSGYLIGLGIGFNQGQALRQCLKNSLVELLIAEKTEALLWLLAQHSGFPKFGTFVEKANTFVANQNKWHCREIETEVYKNIKDLMLKNKIQQALANLHDYYEANFYLQAMQCIDKLVLELVEIRKNKKENQTNEEDSIRKRKTITDKLEYWLETHKT